MLESGPGTRATTSRHVPSVSIPLGTARYSADVSQPGDGLTDEPLRNRLLAALSSGELARLRPQLELVQLDQREQLYEQGRPIQYVYFPETTVVSLTSTLRDGGAVEVGTAGREGMVGLSAFLGDGLSTVHAIPQIPGTALRMDVAAFARAAQSPGELSRLLLRYTEAFLAQVAQTAACNASHLLEQRCARWLLMMHDRVSGEEFPMTHEFLAFMLGVRRAGVTLAMRALQDVRLVSYTRGRVTITDRAGLERASCECYCTVRGQYERLLGHYSAAPG